MVWLIAFVCLGLIGMAGYYSGPIRGLFSFFGLLIGLMVAAPLAPFFKRLLPMLGFEHPLWQFFVPQALAFLSIVIVFAIIGSVIHTKLSVKMKYKTDDKTFIRWERMYNRTGLCVGVLNGAIYFFIIMIPIYIGGYFTAEAATEANNPASAKFLTKTRAELHAQNLDRVLGSFDPTPAQIYKASDIADLVLHNPLLKSRLSHYPPLLTLAQRPEFQALANDGQLLEMIDRQANVNEILKYPPIQAIVTNSALTGQITDILGNDLNDLEEYLTTGKSPKYDDEPILGVWEANRSESFAYARKKHTGLNLRQYAYVRQSMSPLLRDLTITVTTDNQFILRKLNPSNPSQPTSTVGKWNKGDAAYPVTLPGAKPENVEVQIQDNDTLLLPMDGYVLVFDKEI